MCGFVQKKTEGNSDIPIPVVQNLWNPAVFILRLHHCRRPGLTKCWVKWLGSYPPGCAKNHDRMTWSRFFFRQRESQPQALYEFAYICILGVRISRDKHKEWCSIIFHLSQTILSHCERLPTMWKTVKGAYTDLLSVLNTVDNLPPRFYPDSAEPAERILDTAFLRRSVVNVKCVCGFDSYVEFQKSKMRCRSVLRSPRVTVANIISSVEAVEPEVQQGDIAACTEKNLVRN